MRRASRSSPDRAGFTLAEVGVASALAFQVRAPDTRLERTGGEEDLLGAFQ